MIFSDLVLIYGNLKSTFWSVYTVWYHSCIRVTYPDGRLRRESQFSDVVGTETESHPFTSREPGVDDLFLHLVDRGHLNLVVWGYQQVE